MHIVNCTRNAASSDRVWSQTHTVIQSVSHSLTQKNCVIPPRHVYYCRLKRAHEECFWKYFRKQKTLKNFLIVNIGQEKWSNGIAETNNNNLNFRRMTTKNSFHDLLPKLFCFCEDWNLIHWRYSSSLLLRTIDWRRWFFFRKKKKQQ